MLDSKSDYDVPSVVAAQLLPPPSPDDDDEDLAEPVHDKPKEQPDVATETPTAFLLGAGLTKDEANGILDVAGVATMEDLCLMDEQMVSEVAKETGLKLIPAKKLSNAIKELCKKMKGDDQILKVESKDNASAEVPLGRMNDDWVEGGDGTAVKTKTDQPAKHVPAAAAAVVAADPILAVAVPADPPLATVVAADPPLANAIEYEAIPELLFVDMQQEDEEKVAAAVAQLNGLLDTFAWKKNTDQALSLGAIAIILLLMRKWQHSRSIQVDGYHVLAQLSFAAVSIIQSGGIETIMAAMKSFPDDHVIQGRGCGAIHNVFCFAQCNNVCDPTIVKAMLRFVDKLNGIELVVSVMKKFQNNASVQSYACLVLLHLSKDVSPKIACAHLRAALKKGGTRSAVSEAIEKHDDQTLQSCARAFFKNMF